MVPNAQVLLELLSRREREVLNFLASNLGIAERLDTSTGTVKGHIENIYSKPGVRGRREAVTEATGLGILE